MIVDLFSAAITSAIPILLAALGGLVAERSGVLYIGLEGIMAVGAAAGFIAALESGNLWISIAAVIMAGLAFGLIVSVLSVSLNVDQVLLGVALIILGAPLSNYIVTAATGGRFLVVPYFQPINIEFINQIPVIGVLYRQNILGYLTLALVVIIWFILFRTNLGLKLRAVGEDPRCADGMGINVGRIRFGATIFGTILAAIGGAYVTIGYTGSWTTNPIAGRGVLAIAILRIGLWKPHWSLLAALVFGLAEAVQFTFQVIPTGIPPQLPQSIPYILGIVIMILSARFLRWFGPRSLGQPYKRQ